MRLDARTDFLREAIFAPPELYPTSMAIARLRVS